MADIISSEKEGLYRDDGLGVFQNVSRPEAERKKKAIVKVFKSYSLSIVVNASLKTVNFFLIFALEKKIYTSLIESSIIGSSTSIKNWRAPKIF